MSPRLKLAIGLFTNFSLIANQLLAELPPIDFEAPDFVPLELIYETNPAGWQMLSGAAEVTQTGQGVGGGQALRLAQGQEEAWLRREVSWDAAERTAFIDFQIKPTAEPEGSLASFVANGSQIAFQVPTGSQTGQLWVFNGADGQTGSSQWFTTPGKFQIPTGSAVSDTWMRVTLRHDYQRNLWDVFIDGKLAAVNLSFEGRGKNLTSLEFFGSRRGDTLVDDLSADPENMLFPTRIRTDCPTRGKLRTVRIQISTTATRSNRARESLSSIIISIPSGQPVARSPTAWPVRETSAPFLPSRSWETTNRSVR